MAALRTFPVRRLLVWDEWLIELERIQLVGDGLIHVLGLDVQEHDLELRNFNEEAADELRLESSFEFAVRQFRLLVERIWLAEFGQRVLVGDERFVGAGRLDVLRLVASIPSLATIESNESPA